ncbi:MAG: hypothetical protein WC069_07135, partial [Candidatus Shapirobacteria bacterium]
NESFLDTAQLRQNILSNAKLIGYVPTSTRGSESIIDIKITPSVTEDNSTTFIIMDKYTKLLGYDIDGINYPFVTMYANTSTKASGSFEFGNVHIKQGEVVTLQFAASSSNPKNRYQIQSANVDTSTIAVTVQESSSNTYTETYTLFEDLTEVTANSTNFFLEEDHDLNYTIYFGDGVIGKSPSPGNIIIITYLDVSGSVSNDIKNFSFVEPIAGLYSDNVVISNVTSSFAGSEKELIEQIRFRAPYYYTTQNRSVNVNDYKSLLTKDYGNIESVSVWGGEDNDPIVYGKVYISIKTKDYYSLSIKEKETIKADLIRNRNVVTVIPEIVDPEYTYIQVRGKVYYNPSRTSKTPGQLLQLVRASIEDYNDQELNDFEGIFRKYKLQDYIENCDPAISATDLQIYLQKQLIIDTGDTKTYELKFNTPLKRGTFTEKLYSFPQLVVSDGSGTTRNVFIEEIPESLTGVASIGIINPGINFTSVPTVTISGDGTGATAKAVINNNRISSIEVTNPGYNYTRAEVTITGGGGTEALAVATLDNTKGKLRSYYFKTNGEKVVVHNPIGTIDYTTGYILLPSLSVISLVENVYYETDILTVNVTPNTEVIPPLRNRILTIDLNNTQSIQLEIIPR